jgi:hypothetical protein
VYVNLTESKCVFKKCIQKVYSKIEYTLCIEKYILKSVFKFEYTLCIHLRNSQNISSLLPNWRKFQIRENLLSSSKNRFCRKDVVAVFFFFGPFLAKNTKRNRDVRYYPTGGTEGIQSVPKKTSSSFSLRILQLPSRHRQDSVLSLLRTDLCLRNINAVWMATSLL